MSSNKFRISKIPKRFRKSYVAYGNYNNMSHIVFSEVKAFNERISLENEEFNHF